MRWQGQNGEAPQDGEASHTGRHHRKGWARVKGYNGQEKWRMTADLWQPGRHVGQAPIARMSSSGVPGRGGPELWQGWAKIYHRSAKNELSWVRQEGVRARLMARLLDWIYGDQGTPLNSGSKNWHFSFSLSPEDCIGENWQEPWPVLLVISRGSACDQNIVYIDANPKNSLHGGGPPWSSGIQQARRRYTKWRRLTMYCEQYLLFCGFWISYTVTYMWLVNFVILKPSYNRQSDGLIQKSSFFPQQQQQCIESSTMGCEGGRDRMVSAHWGDHSHDAIHTIGSTTIAQWHYYVIEQVLCSLRPPQLSCRIVCVLYHLIRMRTMHAGPAARWGA